MRKFIILLISIGFSSLATACSTSDKKASDRVPDSESSEYAYEKHLEMLDRVDKIR